MTSRQLGVKRRCPRLLPCLNVRVFVEEMELARGKDRAEGKMYAPNFYDKG